jgi:hypothetical protein
MYFTIGAGIWRIIINFPPPLKITARRRQRVKCPLFCQIQTNKPNIYGIKIQLINSFQNPVLWDIQQDYLYYFSARNGERFYGMRSFYYCFNRFSYSAGGWE